MSGVSYRALQHAKVDTASSGDNTIVAANARRIKLVSYLLVASGAVSVKWKAGTTDKSGAMALAANGGVVAPGDGVWLSTGANEALILNLSGAVQVSGHVAYTLEG